MAPPTTMMHYANYKDRFGNSYGPMSFEYQPGGPKRPGVTLKSYYAQRDAAIRRRKTAMYQRVRTGGIAPWTVRSNTGPLNMIDTQLSAASMLLLPGAMNIMLLNGTVPGDLIQNRHSRTIKMSSLYCNFIIAPQSATTVCNYRIFIVYDSQANGVNPAYNDIFLDSAAVGAINGTVACQMPRNPSNMDRFKVLWSYTGRCDGSNTQYTGPVHQRTILKKFIKLKGLETKYNTGVAGTIGDIQTGSLLLCFGTDTATALAMPVLNCAIRLNFLP